MDTPLPSVAQDEKNLDDQEAAVVMDTATALSELKILTSKFTHTNRFERERACETYCRSSAPVCVVEMDSKFFTKFSLRGKAFSKKKLRMVDFEEKNQSTIETPCLLQPRKRSFARNICTRFKPYPLASISSSHDAPSQLRLEDLSVGPLPANVADRASSPAMPRQDSGNKSNPSSPAKSQSCLSTTGSSIVRSRSLDDLEISKLDDCKIECYSYGRCDIETVSQHISKLHVS